ncbi:MAG: transaldolase [Chloroflexota bacterium]|nr:transaldolase [Chloroflexota bacterium]MDE2919883.1 transaldolase [Chloroflexota bacterium]
MSQTPLHELHAHGQSVWLDFLSRDLVDSGELARLVAEEGVRGMTSNPTIFQEAIKGSDTYDEDIRRLGAQGLSPEEMFEAIAVDDISAACDVLRPVFDESGMTDGFVSLEVSPRLAHDTEGTVEEARRLVAAVDRPNLMIKVPATPAGLPAVETLITEGVNVNITLIFAQAVYRGVVDAYLSALENRAAAGEPVDDVASVASTFVSRIDTAVDARLEELLAERADDADEIRALLGKAAIANSKAVYEIFEEISASERYQALAADGAQPQRPLWASTSTKNPEYPATLYVDELIGPNTVNTMPSVTMDAFREQGEVQPTVSSDPDYWGGVLERLAALGVDLDAIMDQLQDEGVQKFIDSYDDLLQDLEAKAGALAS